MTREEALRGAIQRLFDPEDPGEEAVGIDVYGTGQPGILIDAIVALVLPIERDRIRRILLAALPDDPKWAGWVEGVLDRIKEERDPDE